MTPASPLYYLYRRQPEAGIWIAEHGPMEMEQAIADQRDYEQDGLEYVIGIGTSADGRTVLIEWPKTIAISQGPGRDSLMAALRQNAALGNSYASGALEAIREADAARVLP